MSINVTVHGNPISIKRGKMVTCDSNPEFSLRRRIRLQQVRQQSKEIAAQVRNRVRKEKEKQLSKAEQQGKEELDQWKTRKLHNLQQQYQECVKHIGSAHARAALEPNPDDILKERNERIQNEANVRGKLAAEKQKAEDEERKLNAERPTNLRMQVRKLEDSRAGMVSKLSKDKPIKEKPIKVKQSKDKPSPGRSPRKKKKRKSFTTDVTITNNIISDSETIHDSPSPQSSPEKSPLKSLDTSPNKQHNGQKSRSKSPSKQHSLDLSIPSLSSSVSPTEMNDSSIVSPQLSPRRIKEIIEEHRALPFYCKSTRISDRIRQRQLKNQINYDDNETSSFSFISNDIKTVPKRKTNNLCIENHRICDIKCDNVQQGPKQNIPFVPTTCLESTAGSSKISRTSPIKQLDHAQPVVEKISKESVLVLPPTQRNEIDDFQRTMERRDREARCRGAEALKKTKIQKDYRQLMEELPVLQRQERLSSMRTHNPSFFMSDERLQEMERRRQNRIENVFEKYYQKTETLERPLITIKPVQRTQPPDDLRLPFEVLNVTESPAQLNVAGWDVKESIPECSPECEAEILKKKQQTLADLLQRVNRQRELLLQEVASLPPNSNLQSILQDEELFQMARPKLSPKKDTPVQRYVTTATSPLTMRSPTSKKKKKKLESGTKRVAVSTSSNDSSVEEQKKKHKKTKTKKHKCLIKDEGTQTSPSICPNPCSLKQTVQPCPLKSDVTTKKVLPEQESKSKSTDTGSSGKLCEIIIKMAEESSVKISTARVSETSGSSSDLKEKKKSVVVKLQDTERKSHRKVAYERPVSNDVSTSTTYMSPPDLIETQKTSDSSKTTYKNLLLSKPQQTNVERICSSKPKDKQTSSRTDKSASSDSNEKEINPHLLKYIQKLLSMSRRSIDELTISSVSEVSSPGISIIDTPANTSLIHLQNVMNHFNISLGDIQKCLVSSESSNSSLSAVVPDAMKPKSPVPQNNVAQEEQKTVKDDSCICYSPKSTAAVIDTESTDVVEAPYSDILSKYTELTQNCCEKISKLAEMIDKVRLEKERLLSPQLSDKNENSVTSYMELPSKVSNVLEANEVKAKTVIDDNSSSNSSISQEALDQYLLAVNNHCQPQFDKKLVDDVPVSKDIFYPNDNRDTFIPMLQGIPRYDKETLTADDLLNMIEPRLNQLLFSKPKPPPSLLRNSARGNANINMTPHELSTIIEVDTIASSRNISEVVIPRPRSKSPEEKVPSKDTSPKLSARKDQFSSLEFINTTPEEKLIEVQVKTTRDVPDSKSKSREGSVKSAKKTTTPRSRSTSRDRPSTRTEMSGVQQFASDNSTSPEDMEAILRNMGLGWAVSTLKKTQEALALSSSSSSMEGTLKRHISFKETTSTSNSEVSLKEVLHRQHIKKISTSSSTHTDSSSSVSPYQQEIIGTHSKDRSHQRTSTPVQQSSDDQSKDNLFTGDSDISSVRLHSDENIFLSIPNVSLDVNRSLNRTKK